MSCDCKGVEKQRNYYRYYDTPDGCDIYKKMLVTSRYGAMAGLFISTYDVLMYSRAIGFGPMLARYRYHTLPLTLMGATFAGVANGALHARKKDDVFNYFLGGAACGPILAYYLGSYHAIVIGGLALGIIGMLKKDSIDNGYCLFPHPPSHMGHIRGWKWDYTLLEDPRDSIQHTCGKQQ